MRIHSPLRSYFILFAILTSQLTWSQSSLPTFGEFSQAEKDLKECEFDKNAGAIVLFDHAVADHDEEYHMITHRRIRIKIFNQRELDQGNIRIRFYSKDKFEHIRNIKGVTYTEEGNQPVISNLDNRSIYTEREDNFYSSIKFAFPNVKPGSIIEYEYESYMEHYGGLSSWVFQHELPTVKSSFLVTLLPNTEFQYSIQKKRDYPIIIKPIPERGKIYYEMNNIPGLKFEPYMDAVRDYLQKVIFQLSGITNRYGQKVNVKQTWKELANDLATDKDFMGVIKKELSKTDEIKTLVSKETTDPGKLTVIYNFVRDNFTWNDYYSISAPDGLKSTWEKRTGSAGELNLLLINLLQTFDIEVYPLLVAERHFGKVDTSYPFLNKFNKVVAYAIAGNNTYILDATQKFSPSDLIPYPLLNTKAFLVDKKDFRFIPITSRQDAYSNKIISDVRVDNKGFLSGTAVITSSGYAKQIRLEKARTDRKKFIAELRQEHGAELVIDSALLENLEVDAKPLVQNLSFHLETDVSGGFIFIPYNLFTGLGKNPFTANERFTNINFGYPIDMKMTATFHLPEKAVIDKLPPEKTITSPENGITVSRKLKVENNILVANIEFKQTTTLVPFEQYEKLKSFYKEMIELLNDPVIIKVVN